MTITVEDLQSFRSKRFGWLTAAGEILACDSHQHLSVLNMQDLYKELYAQAEEMMYDTLEQERQDGESHPAFHRFDSDDDARRGVMLKVYKDGWIRLGCFQLRNMDMAMEAVSIEKTLRQRKNELSYITDALGLTLIARNEYDRKIRL